MNPPKIFISATSGDLSSAREIAAKALLTINCHPVEQTNFVPDWRSATDMLRGKIGDCQALIHLVGFRYGAEPDPASLPGGTPRRSYTQMEYHLARALGLRVYTFLLPETYPFDVPDKDKPIKADTPEQTQLQAAHRVLIQSSLHLYEKPANDLDLRTCIIALQEKVIGLEQEQQSIAKEVKASHHWGIKVAAALNNLAQLLKVTNGLKEAEPLMQRALKIDEANFGPDHPNVARDLNNLVALLRDTNRLTEAEPLM
jgi:hypothetical protein